MKQKKKGIKEYLNHPDANKWIQNILNEDIYINELKRPFERTINESWVNGVSSGGLCYIINKKKYVENQIIHNF